MISTDARQQLILIAAFILSLITSHPIFRAASELWRPSDPGFLWELTSALPGDGLDIPVVFIIGVLSSWLILFLLDGTKRIQAILVMVVIGTQLIPFLQNTDRILPAIARTPLSFLGGLVGGVLSGTLPNRFYDLPSPETAGIVKRITRWLEFPVATGGLLYAIVAVVLVTGFDAILFNQTTLSNITVGASTIVLVASSFVFFRYDYQQRVAVVSVPDADRGKYHPYIIGGLYNAAEELDRNRSVHELKGDLLDARGANSFDFMNSEFPHETTAFSFTASIFDKYPIPDGVRRALNILFLRPVVVESQGWTTNDMYPDISTNPGGIAARVKARIGYYLWTLVPLWIRRVAVYRRGNVLNRLDNVDVVLLAVQVPLENEEPPTGTDVLKRLLERYTVDPRTDVVLTMTESERTGWPTPNSSPAKREAANRLGITVGSGGDIESDQIILINRWPSSGFSDDVDEDRGLLFKIYR